MKVLVFGCGPAGLLAAHAAAQVPGNELFIISRKAKSALHGCQYLHEPIPGLQHTMDFQMVDYQLVGTPEQYADKVYGKTRPPSVSPQLYVGERPAWNLRDAYEELWARYERYIYDGELRAANIGNILGDLQPDIVFSAVPAPVLCLAGELHTFSSVQCWAVGDAPELGQSVPFSCAPFTVRCDATRDTGYYRVANVFGRTTIEWPGYRPKPPLEDVVRFMKPLATNCDCWPDIVRLGRYGQWRKGVLAHHAYAEAHNRLQQRHAQQEVTRSGSDGRAV